MSKYSFEEKLEAVLRVLEKGYSTRESASVLGVHHSAIIRWIKLYELNGYEGLINSGASYDGKFKIMVVEYMHKNQLSTDEVSAKFCIRGTSTVYKWNQIYSKEGPAGLLKKKPTGRIQKIMSKNKKNAKTEKELIAENEKLRMENEYLKKLQALVQKRIDQENGKKPE